MWFKSILLAVVLSGAWTQSFAQTQAKVEVELPLELVTQELSQLLTTPSSPITEVSSIELSLHSGFARISGHVSLSESLLQDFSPHLGWAPIPTQGRFAIALQTGVVGTRAFLKFNRFRFEKMDITELFNSALTLGLILIQDPKQDPNPSHIHLDSLFEGLIYSATDQTFTLAFDTMQILRQTGLDQDPRFAPYLERVEIWEARVARSNASDAPVLKLTVANYPPTPQWLRAQGQLIEEERKAIEKKPSLGNSAAKQSADLIHDLNLAIMDEYKKQGVQGPAWPEPETIRLLRTAMIDSVRLNVNESNPEYLHDPSALIETLREEYTHWIQYAVADLKHTEDLSQDARRLQARTPGDPPSPYVEGSIRHEAINRILRQIRSIHVGDRPLFKEISLDFDVARQALVLHASLDENAVRPLIDPKHHRRIFTAPLLLDMTIRIELNAAGQLRIETRRFKVASGEYVLSLDTSHPLGGLVVTWIKRNLYHALKSTIFEAPNLPSGDEVIASTSAASPSNQQKIARITQIKEELAQIPNRSGTDAIIQTARRLMAPPPTGAIEPSKPQASEKGTTPLTPEQFLSFSEKDKSIYLDLDFSHYPKEWLGIEGLRTQAWNLALDQARNIYGEPHSPSNTDPELRLDFALGIGPLSPEYVTRLKRHEHFSTARMSDAPDISLQFRLTQLWNAVHPHLMEMVQRNNQAQKGKKKDFSFEIKDIDLKILSKDRLRLDLLAHIYKDLPWYLGDFDSDARITMDIRLSLVQINDIFPQKSNGENLGQYAIHLSVEDADFHGTSNSIWMSFLENVFKDYKSGGLNILINRIGLLKSRSKIREQRKAIAKGVILSGIEAFFRDGRLQGDDHAIDLKDANSALKVQFKGDDFYLQINPRSMHSSMDLQLVPQVGESGSSFTTLTTGVDTFGFGMMISVGLVPEDEAVALALIQSARALAADPLQEALLSEFLKRHEEFQNMLKAYPAAKIGLKPKIPATELRTIRSRTTTLGYETFLLGAAALETANALSGISPLAKTQENLRDFGHRMLAEFAEGPNQYLEKCKSIAQNPPTAWNHAFYVDALLATLGINSLRDRGLVH